MLIVNLCPVNFSSWACLKVRMTWNTKTGDIQRGPVTQQHYHCLWSWHLFAFIYLPSHSSYLGSDSNYVFAEHTTGLCKSYEDKHTALQEKLKESSLRCEYEKTAQTLYEPLITQCSWAHPEYSIFSTTYTTNEQSASLCVFSGVSGSCELEGGLHTELQRTEGGEWAYSTAEAPGSRPRVWFYWDHCSLSHCRQVQSALNRYDWVCNQLICCFQF